MRKLPEGNNSIQAYGYTYKLAKKQDRRKKEYITEVPKGWEIGRIEEGCGIENTAYVLYNLFVKAVAVVPLGSLVWAICINNHEP